MVKVIMHGCNGKMGQMIAGLIPILYLRILKNAMWQRIASLISQQPWQ